MGELSTCGVHNANLEASTTYHIQGGSWKRQETILLLPAAKMVSTKCALSWMHLIMPPNQKTPRMALLGMEVGDAYSVAIDQILATPGLNDCQYILTLEHDNMPPADALVGNKQTGVKGLLRQMEEHPEFACIGGLYWTKGWGGVPQIWGDPRDPILNFRPQPPDPNGGLVECCGTGMGFNLFRLSMFKDPRLRKPWFRTVASGDEGAGTQDLYFWQDARRHGYRCAIDCSVKVGHYSVEDDTTW